MFSLGQTSLAGENRKVGEVERLDGVEQSFLHGGAEPGEVPVTKIAQRLEGDHGVEGGSVDGLRSGQGGSQVNRTGFQESRDVEVVLVSRAHLNDAAFHTGDIEQGGNGETCDWGWLRIGDAFEIVEAAEEGEFDFAAAIDSASESVGLELIDAGALEVGDGAEQIVGRETLGGEEIEILRNAVAETESERGTAVENEVGRRGAEFIPQGALGGREDVEARGKHVKSRLRPCEGMRVW